MKMCQQKVAKMNTLLYQSIRFEKMSPGVGPRFINRAFGSY